jgi:hypothetical protein
MKEEPGQPARLIPFWFARNQRTSHPFIPFRDTIGLELPVGNNGDLSHFAPSGHHPSEADREWKEFQEHGEIDYMKHKKQQALDFIRAPRMVYVGHDTARALQVDQLLELRPALPGAGNLPIRRTSSCVPC